MRTGIGSASSGFGDRGTKSGLIGPWLFTAAATGAGTGAPTVVGGADAGVEWAAGDRDTEPDTAVVVSASTARTGGAVLASGVGMARGAGAAGTSVGRAGDTPTGTVVVDTGTVVVGGG